MTEADVPEPLKVVLRYCCSIEAWGRNWRQDVDNWIHYQEGWPALFARQLREAIEKKTVSREVLFALTRDDGIETEADIERFLKAIGELFYGEPFIPSAG